MKERLSALALAGVMACTIALPAFAAETTPTLISPPTAAEEVLPLPDSVLYYGQVQEILKDDEGNISKLLMTSERYGECIMDISAQTIWVDSGHRAASDPADLAIGEAVYVFHSPMETRSLPPQTAAFAVVRNIPADAHSAIYHEVEDVSLQDGRLTITTDNGGLLLFADEETGLTTYGGEAPSGLEAIQAGSHVVAWYSAVATSYPGQAYADHLMLLPGAVQAAEELLTRADLAVLLHEKAGKPATNYAMAYSDVSGEEDYAEAVRWATSEGLVSGYNSGAFGPNDPVSLEQMVTILWRYAGSPTLMDYPGLSQYADADRISSYAQSALAWAHQQGYLDGAEGNVLDPRGPARRELAQTMLNGQPA